MQRIVVQYCPRKWARAFHASTKRFAALVLHRRCGKTTAVMNHHQRAALSNDLERKRLTALDPTLSPAELEELVNPPGGRMYGHCLPTLTQAKLVAWEPLKHFARVIPGLKINESELSIRYPSGHKLRLFGSDNTDALRGTAFSGFSFDEFSQQDPKIFTEVISKSLGDHLGYAIFCGTIKGKDHLYKLHQAAKENPDLWYALWQDIDTSLATELGATVKVLQQAMDDDRALVRQGIMTQDEFDQEWYLSEDAAIQGAFYLKELGIAKQQGRFTRVPYDPAIPVDTWWDIGLDDSTAIWFAQVPRGGDVRLIDYLENSGEGLPYYVAELQKRGYVYGRHYGPHDAATGEWGSGKKRNEVAAALGLKFLVVAGVGLHDGIHACRIFLSKCYFDAEKCARGIECLRNYRKRYNATLKEFGGEPVHDQFSHGADAFRTGAVGFQGPMLEKRKAARESRYGGGRQQDTGAGWMR